MFIVVILGCIALVVAALIQFVDEHDNRKGARFLLGVLVVLGGYIWLRDTTKFEVVTDKQVVQEIKTTEGGVVQAVYFRSQKESNSGGNNSTQCLLNVANLVGQAVPPGSVIIREQAKGGWHRGFWFFDDDPTYRFEPPMMGPERPLDKVEPVRRKE